MPLNINDFIPNYNTGAINIKRKINVSGTHPNLCEKGEVFHLISPEIDIDL